MTTAITARPADPPAASVLRPHILRTAGLVALATARELFRRLAASGASPTALVLGRSA